MTYPIIQIQWHDSSARHGWQDKSQLSTWKMEDLVCESVGFLLQEDDNVIVLAMGISQDQIDSTFCIPKFAVIKKKILKA